ncbi:hypothetical protein AK812_SmicGene11334 [Symbiodinium microadriaticum]|uniref:Uncharacterized protein n=1 Tax=Symbiodinium microadriaticum TaxID=2951 RepID=A0A1Q9EDI2_SYMMI|nr:hypothetical protein AK812_SmicGene11334 [Symbiodinium microadriaticum]
MNIGFIAQLNAALDDKAKMKQFMSKIGVRSSANQHHGNATVADLRETIQNACYKGMTKKSAKKMQIDIQGELNDLTLAPRKAVRGLGLRDGMILVTKFGLTGGGMKKTII